MVASATTRSRAGLGNDMLTGGEGRDNFVFKTPLNKKTNVDTIADFNFSDDAIWLDNAVFKTLGAGTLAKPRKLSADAFQAGTAAQDAQDRILYDKATGSLFYDRDGTGAAAAVKFATIAGKKALAHHDFFVI